jgi:hypothetical membrane protein
MVNSRNAGFLGIGACVVFWLALFILGSLRPSYSQSTNNISELGAIGTPNATLWNIVGFIIPGLCLAIAGRTIADSANANRSRIAGLAAWLLPLFAVGVAGQGLFPALMVDGVPVITSWHTKAHLITSLISGLAWVLGVLLLIRPMKRKSEWGHWYLVNIIAVLLAIVGSFGRGGGLPDGLVQRVVDAIVFAWYVLTSIKLIQVGGRKGKAPVAA